MVQHPILCLKTKTKAKSPKYSVSSLVCEKEMDKFGLGTRKERAGRFLFLLI